jgi:hypothetical protein
VKTRCSLALVLVPLLAAGCGGERRSALPLQPTGTTTPQARAHLEQLLTIMEQNSIKRLTIDWSAFRATVLTVAESAQSIPDTYPAIRRALELLGDGHSSYRTSSGSVIFVPARSCSGEIKVSRPILPGTIGYIRVGGFSGTAEAVSRAVTWLAGS